MLNRALTLSILAVGVGGYGGTLEGGNARLGTQSQAMCFRDPSAEIAGGFGEAGFDLVPTIAFSSNRDNPTLLPVLSWAEIYLLDIDCTNPRRLTDNDASDIFPALSPDGKKIVFESGRLRQPTDPINLSDLFVMGADGEEQTPLITRAGSASWAPNSKDVVFHASASGTGLPIVSNPGAATSDSDIFVMNIDDCIEGTYGARNITNDPDHIDDDPRLVAGREPDRFYEPSGRRQPRQCHQRRDLDHERRRH
jgi:hypothetical protein